MARLLPVIVFLTGVTMSFFAYSINKKLENRNIESIFSDRANKIGETVNNWLEVNNEILESIESFYLSSEFVNRLEFRKFVSGYLKRHKSIRALGWVPRVKHSEREQYIQNAIKDGIDDFQFTENILGEFVPAGDSEESFPYYYRESPVQNSSVIGFDLASDPARYAALFKARDENKILITNLLDLHIKDSPQKGFLAFNPLYRSDGPLETVEQRRENLTGFILGVYTINDIASSLLMEREFKNIQIIILDITQTDNYSLIYSNLAEPVNPQEFIKGDLPQRLKDNPLSYIHTLSIGGRNWKIIAFPTPFFFSSARSFFSLAVLLFGLILSILISLILKANIDKTKEVERLVHERTKDLAQKEKDLNNTVMELKVSHKKLKETQDQLIHTKKLASIGQMAAGVAHEINNPLAFLCSNMEIMEQYSSQLTTVIKNVQSLNGKTQLQACDIDQLFRGTNKEDVFFFADDIKGVLKESNEGLDRIKNIVTQLRTFSRDRDDDTVIPVKLENLIDNVMKIVKSDALAKGEVVCDYKLQIKIPCEPQKMEQVFLNILSNALQAIPDKGRIEIRTYRRDAFGCVEIRDNGVGIPENEIDKIFDPFFTTKPVGVGTGLGLSISYDIVKKHGGDIEVESAPGKGTAFRVLLPVEEIK
ncbi:MAG: CHASE domain-containing protein [Candidatus Omnitrophota bacterium]